jgi:hypothetical protein
LTDTTTGVLVQYGALGVITCLALLAVRAMFNSLQATYDREKTRADRLEDELRTLNETIRGEYIGTITRASQAISDANRAVADALAAIRRA